MNQLVVDSICNKLKKAKMSELVNVAKILHVELLKIKDGKECKKVKKDLILEIKSVIKTLPTEEIIEKTKSTELAIEIEVKDILKKDINIDELLCLDIVLTLQKFFEENPGIQQLFNNTCDLVNVPDTTNTIKSTIKSTNCTPMIVQGLYILTIGKNNIDYIVKLGSFAESQGMSKRISSFAGGNYVTGSLTNKWFQEFIKRALIEGYTSKFTYYNRIQEKILISDLDGGTKEMMPYVMRPLESDLFTKYNNTNGLIPPIFGSNCNHK